jgi:citrate synthase
LKEGKDCFYVKSRDIAKITNALEEPLRLYDPGYKNTICCTSRISYIDGVRGVLEYRGYRIEQLAEKSSFL